MNPEGGFKHRLKKGAFIIIICFLISCSVMIITTPVHELRHVGMSTLDPCLEVVDFYPFGGPSSNNGDHPLPSVLGCVIVKEAYPGAFKDRPFWSDAFQEIICLSCVLAANKARKAKGLTPWPILPDAYEPCHEDELSPELSEYLS